MASINVGEICLFDTARFWSHVKPINGTQPNACWLWDGQLNDGGYGVFKLRGKRQFAHRFAYGAYCGPIPKGLDVCHRCDNPRCVNPSHLFTGTAGENIADMIAKGRHKVWRGQENGSAKLTLDDVEKIRSLYASGGIRQIDLARQFGVSQTAVSAIVLRKSWSH